MPVVTFGIHGDKGYNESAHNNQDGATNNHDPDYVIIFLGHAIAIAKQPYNNVFKLTLITIQSS